jgi:hypothetical protein
MANRDTQYKLGIKIRNRPSHQITYTSKVLDDVIKKKEEFMNDFKQCLYKNIDAMV